MFDVGFQELVLLFFIGMIVLGPQRLPKVAAEIGKWVGRARRTATQLRRQLEREIELAEIQPPPPPPNPPSTSASSEPAAPAHPPPEQRLSDALSEHAAAASLPEVPATPPPTEAMPSPAPAAGTVGQESTDQPPHA